MPRVMLEQFAQRRRRAVVLEHRPRDLRRHHHHAAVAQVDDHAPAAAGIDAVAGIEDVARGQRQRRAGRATAAPPARDAGGARHHRAGLGVRRESAHSASERDAAGSRADTLARRARHPVPRPLSARILAFHALPRSFPRSSSVPVRLAFGVDRALQLIAGDQPLNGAAVKIKDGSRAAAVPPRLLQYKLQIAALQFLHGGPVGDQAVLGRSAAAAALARLRGDFRRQAIDGDQAVRWRAPPRGAGRFPARAHCRGNRAPPAPRRPRA